MEDNKGIQIKSTDKNAITNYESKEYIGDYKELLKNIKNAQKIIVETEVEHIPMLITVAKRNLTKNAMAQSKDMIINLQKEFNDDGILEFIEKTISLVTAIETSNLLYGDMINIKEVRSYLSSKTTEVVLLRVNKLIKQLKETKYEDKNKLNFIVEQLNQCNKVFEYCWDISPDNVQALQYTVSILNLLIKQRVKLGLDDYNVEVLTVMVENNSNKIINVKENKKVYVNDTNLKSSLDENLFVSEEVLITDIAITTNNTNHKSEAQIATEKFVNISNEVIEDLKSCESNNFINTAFQKYNSIIAAIETLNFMNGTIINKEIVSKNISLLLTEMIYTNYITLTNSWIEIKDKTDDDYVAFYKEIYNYKKLLFEAYEINKENIDALKKSIDIDVIILKYHEKFKISNSQVNVIKERVNYYEPIIKNQFPDFKGIELDKPQSKKKKSFWSKIFK